MLLNNARFQVRAEVEQKEKQEAEKMKEAERKTPSGFRRADSWFGGGKGVKTPASAKPGFTRNHRLAKRVSWFQICKALYVPCIFRALTTVQFRVHLQLTQLSVFSCLISLGM